MGHVSRAGTAARGMTRTMKKSADVGTAQERLAAAEAAAADLEAELAAQIASIPSPSDASQQPLGTLRLKLSPETLRVESSGVLWHS